MVLGAPGYTKLMLAQLPIDTLEHSSGRSCNRRVRSRVDRAKQPIQRLRHRVDVMPSEVLAERIGIQLAPGLAEAAPALREIARDLAATVRNNVTIDWTVRENVRAQLRVLVKRVLRKHGYPTDRQEEATKLVLQQAELCADQWAA